MNIETLAQPVGGVLPHCLYNRQGNLIAAFAEHIDAEHAMERLRFVYEPSDSTKGEWVCQGYDHQLSVPYPQRCPMCGSLPQKATP